MIIFKYANLYILKAITLFTWNGNNVDIDLGNPMKIN